VPAVVRTLTQIGLDEGGRPTLGLADIEETLRRETSVIEETVRRTGSRRAADCMSELVQTIRELTLRHFGRESVPPVAREE